MNTHPRPQGPNCARVRRTSTSTSKANGEADGPGRSRGSRARGRALHDQPGFIGVLSCVVICTRYVAGLPDDPLDGSIFLLIRKIVTIDRAEK